jgi:flagellar basal-body rod modification protein FlgD
MTTITDTTSTLSGVPTTTKPAGSMDQNDFLKLMTAQLTTQDPFNPMDNTQMVAQMAQFSQVAGIAEMNASLKALVQNMASPGRLTDAANWIGRSVLIATDVAVPGKDGGYGGEIALPEGADNLTVSYVDATGATVHSETFDAQDAGTVPFSWDGKNADGETVATGPLKIVVNASVGGEAATPAIATWTTVTGIQSPANGGATQLLTGLGALSPEEALRLA